MTSRSQWAGMSQVSRPHSIASCNLEVIQSCKHHSLISTGPIGYATCTLCVYWATVFASSSKPVLLVQSYLGTHKRARPGQAITRIVFVNYITSLHHRCLLVPLGAFIWTLSLLDLTSDSAKCTALDASCCFSFQESRQYNLIRCGICKVRSFSF